MSNLRDTKHTALPSDTREIIEMAQVENFTLALNRCVHYLPQKPDKFDESTLALINRVKQKNIDIKAHLFIKDKLNVFSGWSEKNKKIFQDYQKRHKQSIIDLCPLNCLSSFNMQTAWRVAIGLGGGSVYENGITLHHIYGVPYLPASAQKGIALRAYQEKHGKDTKEEVLLFGTGEQMGRVIFFDAFPETLVDSMIEPDIINNHYQTYYEDKDGKIPPADWHSPNPVFFLTLKGVTFQFYLGIHNSGELELLQKAEKSLQYALMNIGIGAKTAVGYGLFQ
jgi:CRISPR-associated protein Cmr6